MLTIDNGQNNRSVLVFTTISSFITPFISAAINLALPSIGSEFGLDAITLGWIATSFLLSSAIFMIPMGRMADMYGRKRLFTYGILLYTITSLLCGFAGSGTMLIILRIIQGFGSAMVFSTSTAILISSYPQSERGRVLGINSTAVYLGLSAGPFLGGLITQYAGWRSIFYFNTLLGIIVITLVLLKLKREWIEARGEKFDYAGSLLYSISLLALMYGFTVLPDKLGILLITAGFTGLLLFTFYEKRLSNPVINTALFLGNKAFAFSNLAALINYSATFAVGFLMSLYLQMVKGLTPRSAGLVLVSQPIMMALLSPISGRMSDKIEPRYVASLGMGLSTLGLFILIFVGENTSFVFIMTGLIILGSGFGLFSAPNTNAVMSSVEKKYLGVASSTLGTMRLTGQMFSMGIAMLTFAIFIGHVEISPAVHTALVKSIRFVFVVFTLLCCAGIFFSLFRGRIRK